MAHGKWREKSGDKDEDEGQSFGDIPNGKWKIENGKWKIKEMPGDPISFRLYRRPLSILAFPLSILETSQFSLLILISYLSRSRICLSNMSA